MKLIQKNSFDGLIDSIFQVHDVLQSCAAKSVNKFLTIRNWISGYYLNMSKDDTLAEYGMDDRLFVSKYLVNLPKKSVEMKLNIINKKINE